MSRQETDVIYHLGTEERPLCGVWTATVDNLRPSCVSCRVIKGFADGKSIDDLAKAFGWSAARVEDLLRKVPA